MVLNNALSARPPYCFSKVSAAESCQPIGHRISSALGNPCDWRRKSGPWNLDRHRKVVAG